MDSCKWELEKLGYRQYTVWQRFVQQPSLAAISSRYRNISYVKSDLCKYEEQLRFYEKKIPLAGRDELSTDDIACYCNGKKIDLEIQFYNLLG